MYTRHKTKIWKLWMKRKKLLEGLTTDIKATSQDIIREEMKRVTNAKKEEMKESINAIKDYLTTDMAVGLEELKLSLSEEIKGEASKMKESLDEKLSALENKINLIEGKMPEIEKVFAKNNGHKKGVTGVKENFSDAQVRKFFRHIKVDFFLYEKTFFEMKKNFTTEIEANGTQKIKILKKQLVKIPVREETRDCFLPSQDTIKFLTFDGTSSSDVL